MIESLSAEQISRFPIYEDKWTKIGSDVSDQEPDLDKISEILEKMYTNVRLKYPGKIEYYMSPEAGTKRVSELGSSGSENVRDQVSDQVYDQVWWQAHHQVNIQVLHQVYPFCLLRLL